MAALILAQLITSVNEALKPFIEIESIFCWTDVQVALHWILGEKKEPKQVFVGNRVRQINGLVNKTCWGYCPTKSNPAELASRGIECSEIANNELWWNGPAFLKDQSENWPTFENTNLTVNKDEVSEIANISISLATTATSTNQISLNEVIPCERYSNVGKLLHATALALKLVKTLKSKVSNDESMEETTELISNQDIQEAKHLWHREVQKSMVSGIRDQGNFN